MKVTLYKNEDTAQKNWNERFNWHFPTMILLFLLSLQTLIGSSDQKACNFYIAPTYPIGNLRTAAKLSFKRKLLHES